MLLHLAIRDFAIVDALELDFEAGFTALTEAMNDIPAQRLAGAIMITNYLCLPIKPGSMGKPFPGIVAGILDENFEEITEHNAEGQLAIKHPWPSMFRAYWNDGGVWVNPRKDGQTELEYQMRNWYYFNWLCGDHITEQHIHNLDVANWFLGAHPVAAVGFGGSQLPAVGHAQAHHVRAAVRAVTGVPAVAVVPAPRGLRRLLLGAQGMKKGDLSKFVEDAVRWRVFDRRVQALRDSVRDVPALELQAAIDEAPM